MSPHLDRAALLLRQSRPEMAERELRQALLQDPQDGPAHALLALCLAEREKFDEATAEAKAAIAAEPDLPLGHHALADILRRRNRLDEARGPIREAIRLDPSDAGHWGELARIEYQDRDWKAALDAADRGLSIDPEHDACTNMRAIALTQLGRREEAGRTIGAALARDPDNAVTQANQGWTLLHAGEPRKAMGHFREALRLDPEQDWAKAGIVEAMKARNPLYRWLLAYFLWSSRLDRRVLWGIIVGLWVGMRFLNRLAAANPAIGPYVLPIVVAYAAFALLTWVGSPLANLMLRADRFGRHALSDDQRKASNLVGLALGVSAACLGSGLAAGGDFGFALLLNALWAGLLMIPISVVYVCPPGRPRRMAAAIAGGLALWAALLLAGTLVASFTSASVPAVLFRSANLYPVAILAASLAGNALAQQTVRR